MAIIEAEGLARTFKSRKRTVEAVRGVDLKVHEGEIVGFLGPNGAGKTTTLKMLTVLTAPTTGGAAIFGHPVPSPDAMAHVGFLPENPYVYPYLTPREFVSLCGRLNGLSGPSLKKRVETVIERVGITY